MNTSTYLKTKLAILLAVDALRREPLAEFLAMTEANSPGHLYDYDGLPVPLAEGMAEMARAALAMVDAGPHAGRKACASERGAGDAGERRRA